LKDGKSIEVLSAFGDASRDADARAFAALMRHIKEIDGQQHTVIMIQVENEVGMESDTRDRSPVANQAYAGPAPKELMDYIVQHKDTLNPEFRQFVAGGGRQDVGDLGRGVRPRARATDEIFTAWTLCALRSGRWPRRGKPSTRCRCT